MERFDLLTGLVVNISSKWLVMVTDSYSKQLPYLFYVNKIKASKIMGHCFNMYVTSAYIELCLTSVREKKNKMDNE